MAFGALGKVAESQSIFAIYSLAWEMLVDGDVKDKENGNSHSHCRAIRSMWNGG